MERRPGAHAGAEQLQLGRRRADYEPREDGYPHPEPYPEPTRRAPVPEDPAAVLSAQMRVAAAEMAAAAAEFVQLERERASTTDASRLTGSRARASTPKPR